MKSDISKYLHACNELVLMQFPSSSQISIYWALLTQPLYNAYRTNVYGFLPLLPERDPNG